MDILFPLQEYWTFYAAFLGLVLLCLAIDLGLFHRTSHTVKFKEAALWTVVWFTLAMLFNLGLYIYASEKFTEPEGRRLAFEFLTGYVIEQSLSVDNLFVFLIVFNYFKIPKIYQHRILFYGILGALIFRAIFIAAGSFLMQFHAVIIFFGVFLIFTGAKMLLKKEDDNDDLSQNFAIRLIKKIMPVSHDLHGQKFFVIQNHRKYATPLFVCLIVLEFTDVVFALDSVPAIFAITREPFIVFTSNIFAIMGLRSLFFLLAGVMDKFHFLKVGLAIILIFVGLKMVWLDQFFGGKFPITWSLGIIGSVLVLSVAASLLFPEPEGKK